MSFWKMVASPCRPRGQQQVGGSSAPLWAQTCRHSIPLLHGFGFSFAPFEDLPGPEPSPPAAQGGSPLFLTWVLQTLSPSTFCRPHLCTTFSKDPPFGKPPVLCRPRSCKGLLCCWSPTPGHSCTGSPAFSCLHEALLESCRGPGQTELLKGWERQCEGRGHRVTWHTQQNHMPGAAKAAGRPNGTLTPSST